MSSEMAENRAPVKLAGDGHGHGHPPEPENLQCPRCESTNTKFCYYNNYNLSQPRYFCKSCRRYWTRGGSLRNIPIGGGSRKNSKRSRSHNTATSSPQPLAAVPCNAVKTEPTANTPPPMTTVPPFRCVDVNLNEALPGSFSSLLGSQQGASGFLGLGGYGIGLGPGSHSGFEMLGFGFGKSAGEWAPAVVESVNGGLGGSSGGSSSGCNTWQMETVDGAGLTDGGDCFGWPDLAISTPGTTAGLD